MNMKRVSERKSELKFFNQDYFIDFTKDSDPIVGSLLTIMQWQASLDIQTNSILHQIFKNQLVTIKYRIKYQLKKIGYQDAQNNNKVTKYVSDYHKINQLFTNCLILSRKKSQVCYQLQKFREYIPQPDAAIEQLQEYLNEEVIFEFIFHNYLETYNDNIFTAEIIQYLYTQHEVNLLGTENHQKITAQQWVNKDYNQLSTRSINFKRLNQINKKYQGTSENLQSGYISFIFEMQHKNTQIATQLKDKDKSTDVKFNLLTNILRKIRHNANHPKNKTQIILRCESKHNFDKLNFFDDANQVHIEAMNKQFFETIFFEVNKVEILVGDQQFTFMKDKIIRIQALSLLSSILESLNTLSYVYNQMDLERREPHQFQFQPLSKLIESEFLLQKFYKSEKSDNPDYFRESNEHIPGLDLGSGISKKHLYPSAINSFYNLIKVLLKSKLPDKKSILSILKVRSSHLKNISQTITQLYNIVGNKQILCYHLIQQYIQSLLIQSNCWRDKRCYTDISYVLNTLQNQNQKAGIISQIIYQLDHNYQINQPLKKLIKISKDIVIFNRWQNSISLYRCILQEIIKVRNGLKLDHHYSLNQIHQNFSLFPVEQQQNTDSQEDTNIPKFIFFEQIIEQICKASQSTICLPKLFFFFDLQLRFKLTIFKLQLYWSEKKDSIFDKKVQAFKQFVNTYCSPIFQIINSNTNKFIDVIDKIDELEKLIEILNKEVKRLHYIERICDVIQDKNTVQIIDLKENIERLNYDNLYDLNQIIYEFNPIENKQTEISNFAQKLQKNMNVFSSIRLDEMGDDQPINIQERAKLAQMIYLIHSITANNPQNNLQSCHKRLTKLLKNEKVTSNLYELKQKQNVTHHYKQCQRTEDIDIMKQFYQRLILISTQQLINQLNEQSQDYEKLREFLHMFKYNEIFLSLDEIISLYFWKNEASITTKYHQIYQLMFFFSNLDKKLGKNMKKSTFLCHRESMTIPKDCKKQQQKCIIIQSLHILNQISTLTRIKLYRKIQDLQTQIIKQVPLYKNPVKYLIETNKYIYSTFCDLLNRKIKQTDLSGILQIKFDGEKSPQIYCEKLKMVMLNLVSSQCHIENSHQYGKKSEIQLFGQIKGYQLAVLNNKSERLKTVSIRNKIIRSKKKVLHPFMVSQQSDILKELFYNFNTEILKKTLGTRRKISHLQISEKKMRDDIIWQTEKLKHNVVQKIHQFILMSNVDQQQSYINFKHAVNLQTIKGIQNVIEEQTQMYMKKTKADSDNAFITDLDNQQEETNGKNSSLLDINVKAILNSMKKIKIFWAWKKLMKRTDNTRKQWMKFNTNVHKILSNKKVLGYLKETSETRKQYFREDITCQIIKQDNLKINTTIQELKIDNLEKKVAEYREKLTCK